MRLLLIVIIFFSLLFFAESLDDNNFNFLAELKNELIVINLERSKSRWKKISNNLNELGIEYQRFSAVDGYNINFVQESNQTSFSGLDIKNKTNQMITGEKYDVFCQPESNKKIFSFLPIHPNKSYSAGEMGVWCSNYLIWQYSKNKNLDFVVVLEDDVKITDKNFEQNINNIIRNLPKDADIVFLDIDQYDGYQIPINNYINKFSPNSGGWGFWAMLYSKQGIDKLLSYNCYGHAVDNFIWSIVSNTKYEKPKCLQGKHDLSIYSSKLKLLEVTKKDSEICKMGRGYWHC